MPWLRPRSLCEVIIESSITSPSSARFDGSLFRVIRVIFARFDGSPPTLPTYHLLSKGCLLHLLQTRRTLCVLSAAAHAIFTRTGIYSLCLSSVRLAVQGRVPAAAAACVAGACVCVQPLRVRVRVRVRVRARED